MAENKKIVVVNRKRLRDATIVLQTRVFTILR